MRIIYDAANNTLKMNQKNLIYKVLCLFRGNRQETGSHVINIAQNTFKDIFKRNEEGRKVTEEKYKLLTI